MSDPTLAAFCDLVGSHDPVAVAGGKTRFGLGGSLREGTRLVSAPEGILRHLPEEMTVQVRAGTSVRDLHEALAEKGQRTALPERGGSVGGALAVGENDLHVLGRGRVRESLLQVRYVSADGRLVSGGGPTVKNVTGFDIPRLMVGSLGTLGLIAEVMVRTNPIPPRSIWLTARDVDPFAVRDSLVAASAVLFDGRGTYVQLEGQVGDVVAEQALLATRGRFEEVAGPPPLPLHRWSLTPAQLSDEVCMAGAGDFVASIGVGTVFASLPQPRATVSPALIALTERVKTAFDPTGRLSPGRDVLQRRL